MFDQNIKKATIQTSSTAQGFYPNQTQQNQSTYNYVLQSNINSTNYKTYFQKEYHNIYSNQFQSKNYPPSSQNQNINTKVFLAQFPHISKAVNQNSDTSIIDQLNENLVSLQKLIEANSYELQKMGDLKQLDRIIQATIQQLKSLKQNNQMIHDSIRSQFFQAAKKIEKDLIQMQKQRKLLRQKCLKEINLSISEAKQQKSKEQKAISKQIKQCLSIMREKMSNLSRQLKNLRKQRLFSKGKTFQKLQFFRNKYVKILKQEQNKRVQCDKVIYDLLEGTCNRAELAIRRSVY